MEAGPTLASAHEKERDVWPLQVETTRVKSEAVLAETWAASEPRRKVGGGVFHHWVV